MKSCYLIESYFVGVITLVIRVSQDTRALLELQLPEYLNRSSGGFCSRYSGQGLHYHCLR